MAGLTALPNPWNLIALLLLGVIGLLLLVGFFGSRYSEARLGRIPKIMELPQSLLLIGLAVIIWSTTAEGTPLAALGLLISAGIAFGFLGDLFMADVFAQKNHVLFGMGAFALGHVCYMLGFRQIVLHFGLTATGAYVAGLVIMWALALLIWFLMIRTPEGDVMQYAALGYALFLASMAGYALGIALQQGTFWPLAVGGALFVLSDTLIGARLFGGRAFRYMNDLIWVTYIIAQILIVTSLPQALALL